MNLPDDLKANVNMRSLDTYAQQVLDQQAEKTTHRLAVLLCLLTPFLPVGLEAAFYGFLPILGVTYFLLMTALFIGLFAFGLDPKIELWVKRNLGKPRRFEPMFYIVGFVKDDKAHFVLKSRVNKTIVIRKESFDFRDEEAMIELTNQWGGQVKNANQIFKEHLEKKSKQLAANTKQAKKDLKTKKFLEKENLNHNKDLQKRIQKGIKYSTKPSALKLR